MMHLLLRSGLLFLLSVSLCGADPDSDVREPDDFGVLVMAHGGSEEWDDAVLSAVAPLTEDDRLEVAFGMADALSLQQAIEELEARGAERIAVVRLFISGESWYERTQQILGLAEGAPERPAAMEPGHSSHGHSMAFWRVRTDAMFALSRAGLAEGAGMGRILTSRARGLSVAPEHEDVLILAHGPEDDAENERWLAHIDAHADIVRQSGPFNSVRVETLREDWPEKREVAESRVRGFVQASSDAGNKTLVIPFRVHGFGPYADALDGLEYTADGQGLLPHEVVTQWIADQVALLRKGPFLRPGE